MKSKLTVLALASTLSGQLCTAQTNQPSVEDFKPSAVNQSGKQYPQVNSEGRMRTSVRAPGATNVMIDIGGQRYPMTKRDDGTWIGDSAPQDEGFHYYQIWVDSAQVPDPGSLYFYGASRSGSGIEIPAKDQDFYALKNVPHGQLREVHYFSKTSDRVRRCYVYTPPDYDKDPSKRFPVLYLQHGAGEDETGWGNQGRTGLIMDNLIAEGKAKPFIIVMENGGGIGGGGRGGRRGGAAPGAAAAGDTNAAPARGAGAAGGRGGLGGGFGAFERVLLDDLIPFVDANYRTLADQPHRAMAGLSMGGMQTRSIAPAHLDTFSHIGIFSGGSIGTNDITDMAVFKERVKLVFVSYGSREVGGGTRGARRGGDAAGATNAAPAAAGAAAPRGGGRGGFGGDPKANVEALKAAGINSHYYVSPDTAHEWQSWRRSLYQFAQLAFQN